MISTGRGDRVVLVALMDDADGVRQCATARRLSINTSASLLMGSRRRRAVGRGHSALPAPRLASPGSRDCRPTVAFRRVASRRRFVARQQVMTSRVKTRPTTSHCSRRVRLPVWRRVMNRKSMSVSGMTSWRYLAPLTSHVTAGHVSRPVAIYSDLATMDVDTQRNAGDSRADPRRLYNIHALCCINHCASSPGENVRMKYLPLVHRS